MIFHVELVLEACQPEDTGPFAFLSFPYLACAKELPFPLASSQFLIPIMFPNDVCPGYDRDAVKLR